MLPLVLSAILLPKFGFDPPSVDQLYILETHIKESLQEKSATYLDDDECVEMYIECE